MVLNHVHWNVPVHPSVNRSEAAMLGDIGVAKISCENTATHAYCTRSSLKRLVVVIHGLGDKVPLIWISLSPLPKYAF